MMGKNQLWENLRSESIASPGAAGAEMWRLSKGYLGKEGKHVVGRKASLEGENAYYLSCLECP